MSNRQRRAPSSPLPAFAGDERVAAGLLARLQALLPPDGEAAASSAEVLQEACGYITKLHDEVDGLAERLAELLPPAEPSDHHGVVDGGGDSVHQLIRALLM
ncbi:hypothetical protein ACP70R_008386 [Stipagrostis hirtigluma subsp. patula]